MPSITAKVVADSISPNAIRLTTLQLAFPKFILAEFNTHRVFSRNASSTRAIPTSKLIAQVRDDPFTPIEWGVNQRGMQAGNSVSVVTAAVMEKEWRKAAEAAALQAEKLLALGLHKQWAGRVIEPFVMSQVLVTATEWDNFFALRCHPDAQPEMRVLAEEIRSAMDLSQPRYLEPRQWHLPYVEDDGSETSRKVSVARCARVSYLTHDGRETTPEEDLELYDRLVGSQPIHASPAEHQATPDVECRYGWLCPQQHRNFNGWRQLRAMIED